MSGRGEGPHRRLQECQHGCKKHLGDIISFFFRFISGNLARGEGSLGAPGMTRERWGGDSALGTGLKGTWVPTLTSPL